MRRKIGLPIGIGPFDARTSEYSIINCAIPVKDANGERRLVPIRAELTIDHAGLLRLIQKAASNKSKRSSDGPVTVIIRD